MYILRASWKISYYMYVFMYVLNVVILQKYSLYLLNYLLTYYRRGHLKIFLIFSSGGLFVPCFQTNSGPKYAEHFCETVLNIEQCSRGNVV